MTARPTYHEAMILEAARRLPAEGTCFVGIGVPSAAAVLAKRTRASELFLVYESGILGTDPPRLPWSVADDALADAATALVSVAEIFNYWLQGGRIDVAVLGAAQVDRHGNLNSTAIGEYERPRVRLPGAGGAPEIAGASGEFVVMIHQSRRTFVHDLDFITTVGHGASGRSRHALGMRGRGPAAVVTDIGVYEPDSRTRELRLVALHDGRTVDEAVANTGWPLVIAPQLRTVDRPDQRALAILRELVGSADPHSG